MLWKHRVSLIFCHVSNHQTTGFSNQKGTIQTLLHYGSFRGKCLTGWSIQQKRIYLSSISRSIFLMLIYALWSKHIHAHALELQKKLSLSMKCLNIKPHFSLHLIQWFATLVNYYQIPTSQPNMAFRDRKKVCNWKHLFSFSVLTANFH